MGEAYERTVSTRFISVGAEKLAADYRMVSSTLQKAGATAKAGASMVKDWVERNKLAMLTMAAAAGGLMAVIISNSPTLEAHLSFIRVAFSLLAMEIGENVAPMFELLDRAAWALLDVWDSLSPEVQELVSWVIVLGGSALVLTGVIVGLVAVFVTAGTAGAFVVAAIAALGVVVASAVVIWRLFHGEVDKVTWILIGLVAAVALPIGGFLALAAASVWCWTKLYDLWKLIDQDVYAAFERMGTRIYEGTDALGEFASRVGSVLYGAIESVGDFASAVGDAIYTGLGTIGPRAWGAILAGLESVAANMTAWIEVAYTWGSDLIDWFVEGITDAVDTVTGIIEDAADAVTGFFSFDDVRNDAWAFNSGQDMIKHFSRGLTSAAENVLGSVSMSSPTGGGSVGGMGGIVGGGTTNNITIGQVVMTGDAGSLGAGRRIGDAAGDGIAARLGRR